MSTLTQKLSHHGQDYIRFLSGKSTRTGGVIVVFSQNLFPCAHTHAHAEKFIVKNNNNTTFGVSKPQKLIYSKVKYTNINFFPEIPFKLKNSMYFLSSSLIPQFSPVSTP